MQYLAESLAKEHYDVSIITSDALTARYWYDPIFGKKIKEKKSNINGVEIYRLSCNQLLSSIYFILVRILPFLLPKRLFYWMSIAYQGPLLRGLEHILQNNSFDVIHSSPFPLYLNKQVVQTASVLNKKPKVIITPFFHSEVMDFFNKNLQEIFDKADYIHIVSNAEKDAIQKKFHVKDLKFVTIPLFLNSQKHISIDKLEKKKEIFKIKHNLIDKKIIFFAGNKGYMKGAITLLQVINSLHKKDPSYILIAIGNNMPEWDTYQKGIDQDALLDLGYVNQEEKTLLYEICDIFCMPSKSESFGLTYLEAWQYKKPVIGCDIPSSRELIGGNDAGILVPFADKVALEKAIVSIMNNPEARRRLGEKGYQALKKKYTEEQFFSKFRNLLQ